jgi:hypothetical protein
MIHKRPNWNKCSQLYIGSKIHSSLNFKPLGPGVSVQVGMRVAAEYGESLVCLKITKILGNNDFEAEIECFEPINVVLPKDLKEGETVLIDLRHICSFYEKD